jgi:hypothetical protein
LPHVYKSRGIARPRRILDHIWPLPKSGVPSAEGIKINWVNYHTGLKDVYFRMNAGQRSAAISISIEHRDHSIQALY